MPRRYNPNQPRWGSGREEGGQWRPTKGGAKSRGVAAHRPKGEDTWADREAGRIWAYSGHEIESASPSKLTRWNSVAPERFISLGSAQNVVATLQEDHPEFRWRVGGNASSGYVVEVSGKR